VPDPCPRGGPGSETAAAAWRPHWRTPRRVVGLAIFFAGLALGLQALWQWAGSAANPLLQPALAGGLLAALGTALGTLPALLGGGTSQRTKDALLGFGAGVMLAACSFSLVMPGLAAAESQGASRGGASLIVGLGLLAGAALVMLMQQALQGAQLPGRLRTDAAGQARLRRVWLFVLAVMLHNVPEGLAIGVAFASGDLQAGRALATGIALQDVPEGLVIALALRGVGYGPVAAVSMGALSGLTEPVAAVAGVMIVSASQALLPWGLALAAGAMLFVIGREIIPESHDQGHSTLATTGLVAGFVVMMMLDTGLG
jgi:zinc transporter, ZIP family